MIVRDGGKVKVVRSFVWQNSSPLRFGTSGTFHTCDSNQILKMDIIYDSDYYVLILFLIEAVVSFQSHELFIHIRILVIQVVDDYVKAEIK